MCSVSVKPTPHSLSLVSIKQGKTGFQKPRVISHVTPIFFLIQPFWQLIPQETTVFFLCFDRPETNNCYCVIQRSASFSKTGYIWGQGFIYVLPLHISSAVFWFFFSVANMKQFPLTMEQPSRWVFSFLLQACQHKWIAMIAIVFSSSSMSIKNISQLVFSSTEAFSSILA